MRIVPVATIVVAIPLARTLAACSSGTATRTSAPSSTSAIATPAPRGSEPTDPRSDWTTATPTPTPTPSAKPVNARADVKLGELHIALGLGLPPEVPVIVTNRSGYAANYDIRLSLRGPDGKELDWSEIGTLVYAHQTTTKTAEFSAATDIPISTLAAGVHVVLISAVKTGPA